MKCPKCRSEVGNQSVCPYCGGTVYIHDSSWKEIHKDHTAAQASNIRALEEQIKTLNVKINVLFVLQGAMIALIILLLIAVCFT